jgi:hypothetical protein
MYGTVPLPILADLKGALVAHQYLQLVFFQKNICNLSILRCTTLRVILEWLLFILHIW